MSTGYRSTSDESNQRAGCSDARTHSGGGRAALPRARLRGHRRRRPDEGGRAYPRRFLRPLRIEGRPDGAGVRARFGAVPDAVREARRTRADLWRVHRLGERSTYTWQDAVVRWSEDKADKATALEDRVKFQWLDGYLSGRLLHTITRDDVQAIGAAKARERSRATANRYLALVRAVLKRAAGPWQWIEKAP